MKKIMFHDKYGLTRAVLDGRKTQTRRIAGYWDDLDITSKDVKRQKLDDGTCTFFIHDVLYRTARYKIGEVVAVAKEYADLMGNDIFRCLCQVHGVSLNAISSEKGFNNKMFVRADLMPHHIRITNIRVERMQDISDEDCLAEGIRKIQGFNYYKDSFIYKGCETFGPDCKYGFLYKKAESLGLDLFQTPREAYAALVKLICGKDIWERNPFVFVYEFEPLKCQP